MQKKSLITWTFLLLLLDQLSKYWLFGKDCIVISNIFALETVKNTGMAMGMFSGNVYFALALSTVALCVVLFLTRKYSLRGFSSLGLLLIIAGAFGNLIDRVFLGYVRDMFSLLFIQFYVFNVADIFVTAGAISLGIGILFREKKEWVKK